MISAADCADHGYLYGHAGDDLSGDRGCCCHYGAAVVGRQCRIGRCYHGLANVCCGAGGSIQNWRQLALGDQPNEVPSRVIVRE